MGSERPVSGSGETCVLDSEESGASKDPKELARQEIEDIHRQAMAALDGKAELRRPFRLLKRLTKLEERPLSAEFLEARVAILTIAQARPTLAVATMRRLQWRYKRSNAIEKFDAFDARIKAFLGGRTLSNHGFDKANFNELDHTPIWERIKSQIGVLEQKGYDVFLNSGTLLGVMREGRLIDHDNDIDLAVILKSRTMAEAAEEWSDLGDDLDNAGLLVRDPADGPAIYKLSPIDGIQVDLFPCWIEEDQVYVYPHTFGEMTEAELRPLSKCAVSGNPIPGNAEKMLTLNYGEDWKTPDPYFVFPWPGAKRRFSEFLQEVA